MSLAPLLGPVSTYIRDQLARLLDRRRVVVWYDGDVCFKELLPRLELPNCVVVEVGASMLRARRAAEAVYRRLDEPGDSSAARGNLLIYLPTPRGPTPEQQQQDPFEAFARCGEAFGDQDGERLQALAELALPQRAGEIAELFRNGRPTLALLDGLADGARFPLLRQALGTEAPVEALAAALSRPDAGERQAAVPGALAELMRLAEAELGLPRTAGGDWPAMRARLANFLLASELAFDLPGGPPAALEGVALAESGRWQVVLAVCDRLRETDAGREAYIELAGQAERELRLPQVLAEGLALGSRDTFPCQERARLRSLVRAATSGETAAARALLGGGERSIWRRDPERALLWQVAQRCLGFLELAAEAASRPSPKGVRGLVEAYVAADGGWRVDRAQRLFEQAGAQCAQDDEVEPLLRACRERYRATVGPTQTAFQAAVRAEGWPPEGVRRQTQVFDTQVGPELAARRKTAYFLVDSLRYEMGRDLAAALEELGTTAVNGVVTVLPTTTPCGMAALMPGADGAFSFVEHRHELAPAVAGVPLPSVNERKALLATRYGDRLFDITLDDMLSCSPRILGKRIGPADFVVVRTQDIDALGEGWSLFHARKMMSDVVGDLKRAVQRLAALGFQTLVFASDHGHVLVPETLPGDVVAVPPGEWLARKRRSLLGRHTAQAPGVLLFRAQDLGITGPVDDFATAADFKTFQAGAGYFHEGLSLQECVVPVVVARVQAVQPTGGGEQVSISYRSTRYTSVVVGLKLLATSMFSQSLTVRLEAFGGPGAGAEAVGQAGDCDARDPATGEVMLPTGSETGVPLVIDPDFSGPSIEVRASDPRTGVVLARLTLENGRLD